MDSQIRHQLAQINQQIRELAGIYRSAVSQAGISENEFWIWYTLVIMEGNYSQQDICCLWCLSKQTVNTIITQLCRRGMLTLDPVPGSRNRKIIRLTPQGLRYGTELVAPVAEAECRALARQSPQDRSACIQALGNYIRILKEELHGTEA